jgi:hypothetical protein
MKRSRFVVEQTIIVVSYYFLMFLSPYFVEKREQGSSLKREKRREERDVFFRICIMILLSVVMHVQPLRPKELNAFIR